MAWERRGSGEPCAEREVLAGALEPPSFADHWAGHEEVGAAAILLALLLIRYQKTTKSKKTESVFKRYGFYNTPFLIRVFLIAFVEPNQRCNRSRRPKSEL